MQYSHAIVGLDHCTCVCYQELHCIIFYNWLYPEHYFKGSKHRKTELFKARYFVIISIIHIVTFIDSSINNDLNNYNFVHCIEIEYWYSAVLNIQKQLVTSIGYLSETYLVVVFIECNAYNFSKILRFNFIMTGKSILQPSPNLSYTTFQPAGNTCRGSPLQKIAHNHHKNVHT